MSAAPLDTLDVPMLDFADATVAANPFRAARTLARDHWIARLPVGYVLLRNSECAAVVRDRRYRTPEALGLAAQGVTSRVVLDWASGTLLGLDGEAHRRIRRLAQPAFTPHKGELLRSFSNELIQQIYDPVRQLGKAEVAVLNNSYVVRVICKVLGFPDADWQQVAAWADAINQVISVSVLDEVPRIEKAILELNEYTATQIEYLRRSPGDSLGSALVSAEEEGDRLTPKELVQLFETLLMAGAETTQNMLSLGMWLFSNQRDAWRRLADDPSLVPSAVEEVLRFRPPFIGTARVATEDMVLHETVIPDGTQLIIGVPAANFDSSLYEDAERFDIERFVDGRAGPGHLTFGGGMHVCIGAYLARVELQEALRALPPMLQNLRIDDADAMGVRWTSPFGVHGPIHLPLQWDPA